MQDIEERDLNANTKIYFEVRATALHPRLHTEGFQLSTIGSFTKGPPPRNYNNTNGSTQLQLSHTSTQEGVTKPSTKQRKKYNLVITKITNNIKHI